MPLGRVRPLGMRSFLIALCLVLFAGAVAALTCTQYRKQWNGKDSGWVLTQEAACAAMDGPYDDGYARILSDTHWVLWDVWTCKGTSTLVDCTGACSSPIVIGGVESRNGDYCEPDVCSGKVGQPKTVNGTFGWSLENRSDPTATWWDSKGVGDFSYSQVGAKSCVDGCEVVVVSLDQAYQSMERHANGMFRWSIDYGTEFTGKSCVPSDSPAHMRPSTPEPSCPGAVGEVNGQRVCIPGSGHSPSNAASAVAAVGGVPVTSGNPAAGEKPTSGPGSGEGGVGRTPVVGNGGNAGGSSSAAGGELPTGPPGEGTPGDPYRPKDPCGLPGTPACKLDERGTPTGEGAYSGATAALDTASLAERGAITGAGSSVQGLSWAWAWQLPAGACSSIDLSSRFGSGSVDPCSSSAIALLRSLLGYLYFGLAAAYIWRSAIAAPKG